MHCHAVINSLATCSNYLYYDAVVAQEVTVVVLYPTGTLFWVEVV